MPHRRSHAATRAEMDLHVFQEYYRNAQAARLPPQLRRIRNAVFRRLSEESSRAQSRRNAYRQIEPPVFSQRTICKEEAAASRAQPQRARGSPQRAPAVAKDMLQKHRAL